MADQSHPIINQFSLAMCEIDGYPIDAVLSEDHSFENEVTSFPVEVGVDITDHVRVKPVKVTMEGIVSDTPLGLIANHSTRQDGLPSDTSYAKLLRVRDSQEPVTIISSLGVFKNMVMASLSAPRASGEPHQFHFKASFVQIQIVTNQRRLVRTATPGGQKPIQAGEKLAKLGVIDGLNVFTLKKSDPRKPVYSLILTSPNGDRHYFATLGSPAADGWVSDNTYHPFTGNGLFGPRWDEKSKQWVDHGKPITKFKPKQADNNGWHEFTSGLSNF